MHRLTPLLHDILVACQAPRLDESIMQWGDDEASVCFCPSVGGPVHLLICVWYFSLFFSATVL